MTEKEKAKAYDEAIERAKKLYGNGITEEIFSELKEDDTERIRKNCIHFLELQKQHHAATFEIEECIDWLEKQGEQNLPYANERTWLYLVSDVLTWKDGIGQYLDDPRVQELAKRLCSEYAQKLYNPSVLSNSSNTAKNKRKFDPKTLKAFDMVLVKMKEGKIWYADIISVSANENKLDYCTITIGDADYDWVIPYNDDTKHLVGTKDEAPEYYRYWED